MARSGLPPIPILDSYCYCCIFVLLSDRKLVNEIKQRFPAIAVEFETEVAKSTTLSTLITLLGMFYISII